MVTILFLQMGKYLPEHDTVCLSCLNSLISPYFNDSLLNFSSPYNSHTIQFQLKNHWKNYKNGNGRADACQP